MLGVLVASATSCTRNQISFYGRPLFRTVGEKEDNLTKSIGEHRLATSWLFCVALMCCRMIALQRTANEMPSESFVCCGWWKCSLTLMDLSDRYNSEKDCLPSIRMCIADYQIYPCESETCLQNLKPSCKDGSSKGRFYLNFRRANADCKLQRAIFNDSVVIDLRPFLVRQQMFLVSCIALTTVRSFSG